MSRSVRIWGPGSLSNLGPGFDTIGVAVRGIGDVVEVARVDTPGVTVLPGNGVWEPPSDPTRNTAALAAAHVLAAHPGVSGGLTLRIVKGIRPGSGLGSSAASAAAAALGALRVLGDTPREEAIAAALAGEAGVSGAVHGDNVLPALLGGVILTSPSDPAWHRRVVLGCPLHLAIVRPDVEVLTAEARAMLPKVVPLRDAIHNASSLAFLVDALRAGDAETVGRCIELDRLVEPVRARLVPGYSEILDAARSAGALGAALSGSGPALFAVCSDHDSTLEVVQAMMEATRAAGLEVQGIATRIDNEGARPTTLEGPERTI